MTIGSWQLNFFVESSLVLIRSFPGSFCHPVSEKYIKHIDRYPKMRFFQKYFRKLKINNFQFSKIRLEKSHFG